VEGVAATPFCVAKHGGEAGLLKDLIGIMALNSRYNISRSPEE
jgi:hypothetical protein